MKKSKTRNSSTMKISMSHLVIYMLFISIFKPFFLPQVVQQAIKISFLFLIFIFLVVKSKRNWLVNESVPFSLCVILSSAYNYIIGRNDFGVLLDGILYAICFYLIFTVIEFFGRKDKLDKFIDCLYKITTIYCVVSYVTFKFPVGHDSGVNWIYALGNKFATSYYFILYISLFCIKNSNRIRKRLSYKALLISLIVLSLIYMYLVDCMTAAFSLIAVVILVFVLKTSREFLLKPNIVVISLLISLAFPFILSALLENNSIRQLIYITLGRQRSIGGRLNIYSIYLLPLLKQSIVFGFGYGSGIMSDVTGGYYGNTQNGLLEHIYNFGIVGGIVLFLFIISCYKKCKRNETTLFTSMIVYALIIAGLVEVTYGYMFFLGLSLVRWLPGESLYSKPTNTKKKNRKIRRMLG